MCSLIDKMPTKAKIYYMENILGCLPARKNLRSRGIKCDTLCESCGVEEDMVNHILFEGLPAMQGCALSHIPTSP